MAVNTNNDETNLLEVTVNVFSSEYNDTEAKWETECSGIENIDNSFFANIDRVITDKTVCDIPYDEMYIHWLCAKICYWQKNFAAYNQHMTSFNQLLSDYSHYIIERSPSTDDGKFVGWI